MRGEKQKKTNMSAKQGTCDRTSMIAKYIFSVNVTKHSIGICKNKHDY